MDGQIHKVSQLPLSSLATCNNNSNKLCMSEAVSEFSVSDTYESTGMQMSLRYVRSVTCD